MRVAAVCVCVLLLVASLLAWRVKAQDHPPVNLSTWRGHELAVTSNADVLTSSITPSRVGNFRLTVAIPSGQTNSIVNVQTNPGSGLAYGHDLNDGTALTAGRLYTFVWGANPGWTYNLQFESTTQAVFQLDLVYNGVN